MYFKILNKEFLWAAQMNVFVVKKANIQFVLKIKIRHQVIFSPSLMCCILKTIVSVL